MRKRLISLLMCVSLLLGLVPVALAAAPEDGLVAHYDFNEVQEGVVRDLTGNGHDGTIHGSVTADADGKEGTAARFDGASYIEIPDDDALDFAGGDFTVALWIKMDENPPGGWHTVLQKGRLTETAWYGFFMNGSQVHYSEDLVIQSQAVAATIPGRWMHACAVHSAAGNIKIYIDGQLVKQMDTCNQEISSD